MLAKYRHTTTPYYKLHDNGDTGYGGGGGTGGTGGLSQMLYDQITLEIHLSRHVRSAIMKHLMRAIQLPFIPTYTLRPNCRTNRQTEGRTDV